MTWPADPSCEWNPGLGKLSCPLPPGSDLRRGLGGAAASGLRCGNLWCDGLLGLRGGLGPGRILFCGGEDGVEDGAFHAGHELDHAGVADVLNEAVDDVVAELAVGHLPAAEAEAGLHLVALIEEADGLIFLGLVVVFVDGDGELDFLNDDDLLLFAGGALALFFFVEVAAVVLDTADGRDGVGRDFDQIEAALAGYFEGLKGRQDAELLAVFVDDADFACANPVVDADKGLGRTFVECDGTPPRVPREPCRRRCRSMRLLRGCTLSIASARLRLRSTRVLRRRLRRWRWQAGVRAGRSERATCCLGRGGGHRW